MAYKFLSIVAVIFALVFTSFSPLTAEVEKIPAPLHTTTLTDHRIPLEYGEVIYDHAGSGPCHLYIIGTSHRDSITRANGKNTSAAQFETFKIGEWLILNEGVNLLLPEGFFKKRTERGEERKGDKTDLAMDKKPGAADMKTLLRRLSDDSVYVNAEMLLNEQYGIRTQQVEDRDMYNHVRDGLYRLGSVISNPLESILLKAEIDYLQERRTAAMLQNIPDVMERELQAEGVKSSKALFTIGISHISEILRFLKESRIHIKSPLIASKGNDEYLSDLFLTKKNFSITIILPRTLAEDHEVLKLVGLDSITTRENPPAPPTVGVTVSRPQKSDREIR